VGGSWKVYIRLPGRGNSNSHSARPVHQISSMLKWIPTRRLSIQNSLSLGGWQVPPGAVWLCRRGRLLQASSPSLRRLRCSFPGLCVWPFTYLVGSCPAGSYLVCSYRVCSGSRDGISTTCMGYLRTISARRDSWTVALPDTWRSLRSWIPGHGVAGFDSGVRILRQGVWVAHTCWIRPHPRHGVLGANLAPPHTGCVGSWLIRAHSRAGCVFFCSLLLSSLELSDTQVYEP